MPPVLIDLHQLVELAIGTPDVGVINFNVLSALLHVVVRQLNFEQYRVEFRGEQCGKFENLIPHIPTDHGLDIEEYAVEEEEEDGVPHQKRIKKMPTIKDEINTILVIRKKKEKSGDRLQPGTPMQPLQPVQVPSNEDFRRLPSTTSSIHDVLSNILPDNAALIHHINPEQSPVSDMWNMLNVTKRLDATEIAVKKMIGMINDLGKEYGKVYSQLEFSMKSQDVLSIKGQIDDIEQKLFIMSKSNTNVQTTSEAASVPPAKPANASYEQKKAKTSQVSGSGMPKEISARHPDCSCSKEEFAKVKTDLDYIKMAVQRIAMCSGMKDIANYLTKELGSATCPGKPEGPSKDEIPGNVTFSTTDEGAMKKMRILEKKLDGVERRMATTDKRIHDIDKDFSEISDRIEDILVAAESKTDQRIDFAELFEQLNELNRKIALTQEQCTALLLAKENFNVIIDNLTIKTDELLLEKVDHEELDELLAEKADYTMVQRKVAVDQFEATKRELGLGISETIAKAADQEKQWQQQFESMRSAMEQRIEKPEMDSLKDYVNNKVQQLQDRIKAIATLRRDAEAAATKTKYLHDVTCLSCEQDVIMKMDEPGLLAKGGAMVPMKSNKPQLTYALDIVRQEISQIQTSRNLNHFQTIFKGKESKHKEKRYCARYCGGSHTTIAPNEYLKRQFPKTPEHKQKEPDNLVKGNDGTIYKGAPFEECRCGDDPKIITLVKTTFPDVQPIDEKAPNAT